MTEFKEGDLVRIYPSTPRSSWYELTGRTGIMIGYYIDEHLSDNPHCRVFLGGHASLGSGPFIAIPEGDLELVSRAEDDPV